MGQRHNFGRAGRASGRQERRDFFGRGTGYVIAIDYRRNDFVIKNNSAIEGQCHDAFQTGDQCVEPLNFLKQRTGSVRMWRKKDLGPDCVDEGGARG